MTKTTFLLTQIDDRSVRVERGRVSGRLIFSWGTTGGIIPNPVQQFGSDGLAKAVKLFRFRERYNELAAVTKVGKA